MATTPQALLAAVKTTLEAATDGAGDPLFKGVHVVPSQSLSAALKIPALPFALIVDTGGELVPHTRGAIWDGEFVVAVVVGRPKDVMGEEAANDALTAIDDLLDSLSYSVADALWVTAEGEADEFDLPELAVVGAGGVSAEPLQVVSRTSAYNYSILRS